MSGKLKSIIAPRAKPGLIAAAVVLMVFAGYGLSLKNGFVWDDETFIVNNPYVHDISKWPSYFTQPDTISDQPVLSRMYRPVQTLSFALDAALWGTWAGGFHLVSLLLHIATCFAIYFAFSRFVGRRSSVIAAMLFSVHPALSEGVLSLASRGNQLYTLFALLSLGFFFRTVKPLDKFHLASLLAVFLALFSKEPAIAYLALLPLLQQVAVKPWPLASRRSVLLYAPVFIIAGIYLAARSAVVDSAQVMPFWGGSFGATVLLQAKVFIVYLKLLFWPFDLQGRYTAGETDLLAVFALVVNIALVITAIFAWRRSQAGKLLALAIAWFYISLAPVSNLIPLPGSMMGERFIYFTFAGMIPLLLGSMDDRFWSRYRRPMILSAPVFLAAFLFTDINRTMVWKDNAHFFQVLARQEPDNPVVQIRAAQSEIEQGKIAPALARLERLVKVGISTPFAADRASAYYWYGKALLLSDRPVEAFAQFSQVASLETNYPRDLVLLWVEAAARANNLDFAQTLIQSELSKAPGESAYWNALGNILSMSGDKAGAIAAYNTAISLDPSNTQAMTNLQNLKN